MADIRAHNARIGESYDNSPYDPPFDAAVGADRLLGIAALFGADGPGCDVLDIGCGAGQQLAGVGAQTTGRLVGFDLSARAIELTRERLAPFGERADVRQADVLDVVPDRLGQFDLIYLVGVLYVTPEVVQARMLDLVARALKPGGVALITYYAGAAGELRAALYPMLRQGLDPAMDERAKVAAMQARAAKIAASIDRSTGFPMATVAGWVAEIPPLTAYHEGLVSDLRPLRTSALQGALGAQGIDFVTYLEPRLHNVSDNALVRAMAADELDFGWGGYRHAVFMRGPQRRVQPRSDAILWRVAPAERTQQADGAATFVAFGGNLTVNVAEPLTAAVLDVLGAGPARWSDAVARALDRIGPLADRAAAETMLDNDLVELWRMGLVEPLRAGVGAAR